MLHHWYLRNSRADFGEGGEGESGLCQLGCDRKSLPPGENTIQWGQQ